MSEYVKPEDVAKQSEVYAQITEKMDELDIARLALLINEVHHNGFQRGIAAMHEQVMKRLQEKRFA